MWLTKEQIEWLWRQCGFIQSDKTYHYELTKKIMDWLSPNGDLSYDTFHHKGHLPPTDLNNLQRYALPELAKRGLNIHIHIVAGKRIKVVLSDAASTYQANAIKLEDALVEAISKAFGIER